MKKRLISLTIAGLLATGSVQAGNLDPETDHPHRQAIGFGIGTVAGAIVAGPLGMVIGSALGTVAGWGNDLSTTLGTRNKTLENTRAELASLETRHDTLVALADDTPVLDAKIDPGPA